MKKILSLILTVLIILSTLLLSGCGDKGKFVGKWTTTIKLADKLNEKFKADENMAEYVNFTEFNVTLIYTFNKKGTYSVTVDENETKKSFAVAQKDFEKIVENYMVASMKAQGFDMTLEQILKLSGTSMEEIIGGSFNDELFDDLTGDIATSGNYKVKNGKLYTTGSTAEKVNEDDYETYEIVSKKEIKLLKPFGKDAEDIKDLYPLVLKKIKK
ncbi:MAG: hypothetical protein IKV81_07330 [Clostridia bacterium]|nr:hypothetical protein [Clostridia bacterium]